MSKSSLSRVSQSPPKREERDTKWYKRFENKFFSLLFTLEIVSITFFVPRTLSVFFLKDSSMIDETKKRKKLNCWIRVKRVAARKKSQNVWSANLFLETDPVPPQLMRRSQCNPLANNTKWQVVLSGGKTTVCRCFRESSLIDFPPKNKEP